MTNIYRGFHYSYDPEAKEWIAKDGNEIIATSNKVHEDAILECIDHYKRLSMKKEYKACASLEDKSHLGGKLADE